MAGTYNTINVAASGGAKTYTDFASFPAGSAVGDLALAEDTKFLYYWDGALWQQVESSTPATGQYKPEPLYVITASDITNKYILLAEAPTDRELTTFVIFGGPPQAYGVDFIVTLDDGGKRLSWDGLGLDSIIEENDQVSVIYN
jgi:DNA-binding beta-propeller fold protein YncE